MNHRARALVAAVLGSAVLAGCSSARATPPPPPTPTATIHQAALTANPGVVRPGALLSASLTPILASVAQVQIINIQVQSKDTSVVVKGQQVPPDQSLGLAGWWFRARDHAAQVPSGAVIPPGSTLVLHAAAGTNDPSNVYLGLDTQAVADFLEPGTVLTLEDTMGKSITQLAVPAH